MNGGFLLPLLVGLALSTVASGGARLLFHRLALIDRPGTEDHKHHAAAVPYGGGAAVLLAVLVAMGLALLRQPQLAQPTDRGPLWPIAGGALALFCLGQVDDLRPLPARLKLLVQILIISAVVLLGGLQVDFLATRDWPVLALSSAVLWCVLVTNAYNLLDHADGFSATTALISAVVLLAAALMAEDPVLAALWAALIGALGGFLIWNLPPARLYLGDAGSLPLGFLLGAGALSITFWPSSAERPVSPLALTAPLLITAIPIYDTTVVMIKRLRRGRPVFRGDRSHIGHRLGRLGLSKRAGLACIAALQTALAGSALLLRYSEPAIAGVILAQAACVLIVVILLEARRDHES
ncbi:MAG: MraY family glycosyltransferase [Planctomycetota bacterium]